MRNNIKKHSSKKQESKSNNAQESQKQNKNTSAKLKPKRELAKSQKKAFKNIPEQSITPLRPKEECLSESNLKVFINGNESIKSNYFVSEVEQRVGTEAYPGQFLIGDKTTGIYPDDLVMIVLNDNKICLGRFEKRISFGLAFYYKDGNKKESFYHYWRDIKALFKVWGIMKVDRQY